MTTLKQARDRSKRMTSAHGEFQKGLTSHAYFKLNDYATSEDLVQITFMKTWSYLVREGKIHIMKAFLYHILNNLIVDEYRKRKNLSLDLLVEKGYEPSDDQRESLIDLLDGKGALLLIAQLPKRHQAVLRMRYVQGLTLEEMALATGVSKNTVSVRSHRGLAKLKALYVSKHGPLR